MLLVERWVTQHRLHAFTLNPRQRVVHFKLATIHILRQVMLHVQFTGGHRHIGLINKAHLRLRVLHQCGHADDTVTAAQIDNVAFNVMRQMIQEQACADIQVAA
ncbi:hypothetical protein D3C75_1053530 [compost metagenome]